jgi:phospholipid N-methyltransferase
MTQKQKEHSKELRDRWNRAKTLLTDQKISEIDAIIQTHNMGSISQTGFMVVSMEMKQQGFDGIPYLDAKTYQGWKENGFQVRKGEKSKLGSITWVGVGKKEPTPEAPDGKNGFIFPKSYNLFHRSQVDAIGSPDDKPTKTRRPAVSTVKPQSNAKFLSMADTLTAQIENKQRPMTQNPTPKRNREYNSRLWEAGNLSSLQKLLLAMSDCIEKGTLPEALQGITKKAELTKLVYKGASSNQGYYSCIPDENYSLDTPEALAAQELIAGNREEERKQREINELAKLKQSLLLQKIDDFFPTPDVIIERMIALAGIEDSDTILEPSAGMGNILDFLPERAVAVEQNYDLCNYLEKTHPGTAVIQGDFLELNGNLGMFDRIVMNPPFSRGADIKHIKHALEHLNEGGKLVSLCANGPRQAKELMPLADLWEDLPQGSFKEAGTGVNVALLVIQN